jgi:AAHS family 4-hydroxybenzoate transporter-like MFS transporter
MAEQRYEIDDLVDGQKFGSFNLFLLIWSFLATYVDGFEISAIGLAVPHLTREWSVEPGSLGPMLSSSLFGIFLGAPLSGFIGDRFGRRVAIISGCILFGVTTLAIAATETVGQMTALRFLTGIGMGAVMTNAIALNSELAPKRLRARLVILMFMGVTLGAASTGVIAALIVPDHGWESIFILGGGVALLVSAGLAFALPESVKFLAGRNDRNATLIATLRRMRPDLDLPAYAIVTVRATGEKSHSSIGSLFANGLGPITLLMWFCFAVAMMANYFLTNWLPLLLEAEGFSPQRAALMSSTFQFGAVFGGLAMSFLFDRWGFAAVMALLLAATPVVLLIGTPMPALMIALLIAVAGFCVLGAQFGINAASGLIYPTAHRAKGIGLAFAVGRLGSIAGPVVGAALIARDLALSVMLLVLAVPLVVGAAAAALATWLVYRRKGEHRLSEFAEVSPEVG